MPAISGQNIRQNSAIEFRQYSNRNPCSAKSLHLTKARGKDSTDKLLREKKDGYFCYFFWFNPIQVSSARLISILRIKLSARKKIDSGEYFLELVNSRENIHIFASVQEFWRVLWPSLAAGDAQTLTKWSLNRQTLNVDKLLHKYFLFLNKVFPSFSLFRL